MEKDLEIGGPGANSPRIDKKRLAARFGARAASYNNATPVQENMGETLLERIRYHFAGRSPARVLEIGCGTGRLTRRLAGLFPAAEITAVDISAAMVAAARAACPSAECLAADAEDLVHRLDGAFDLIVSNATVQWFQHPGATMERIRQRLAPGGLLALSTLADRTFCELADAFALAYNHCGMEPRRHLVSMPSVTAWQSLFPRAEIVESEVVKLFPDARAFLRSIQEAGVGGSLADPHPIPRRVLLDMFRQYAAHHPGPEDGTVRATYHICHIYLARRDAKANAIASSAPSG